MSASRVPEAGAVREPGDWLITLKDPKDGQWALGRNGLSAFGPDDSGTLAILAPAMRALAEDTPEVNGRKSLNIHQLGPYLKTPEQKAAYQRLLQNAASK